MMANLTLQEVGLFFDVQAASKIVNFSLKTTFCGYAYFGSGRRVAEANIADATTDVFNQQEFFCRLEYDFLHPILSSILNLDVS